MAGQQAQKKVKGLPKRVGRGTGKAKRARHHLRLPEKKLRRLVRNNTAYEAYLWARERSHYPTLRKVLKAPPLRYSDGHIDNLMSGWAKRALAEGRAA